jgi:hypothetical protein
LRNLRVLWTPNQQATNLSKTSIPLPIFRPQRPGLKCFPPNTWWLRPSGASLYTVLQCRERLESWACIGCLRSWNASVGADAHRGKMAGLHEMVHSEAPQSTTTYLGTRWLNLYELKTSWIFSSTLAWYRRMIWKRNKYKWDCYKRFCPITTNAYWLHSCSVWFCTA